MLLAGFRQCRGLSTHRDVEGVLFVTGLHFVARPYAVVRRVADVIVDAFNGLAGWCLAHVSDKGREVLPSLTHRDAASAVVFPFGVVGVRTSLTHVDPDVVGRGRCVVLGEPVRGSEFSTLIRNEASA